jgi:uracil-DNA glycosylase family protein
MVRKASTEQYPTAEAFMPPRLTLAALREAAEACRGCPLYKTGTQTVFGEGQAKAKLMLVGEQPGDREDREGKPFVGPSGDVLNAALEEVGIDRGAVYVTNAVKHFKWEARGARRIHAKPNAREMAACKPWLVAEMEVLKPQIVVCLGATAAQDLLGKDFRITRERGKPIKETGIADWVMATYHPSAILRMPDRELREKARREFTDDLRLAAQHLATLA